MFAVGANAQKSFRKGDWLVGAQVSGLGFESHFNDGAGGSRQFNFGATGGLFLMDKLAVDLAAGVDYTKVGGNDSDCGVDFGAGIRYYPVGNLFARLGYRGQTGTGQYGGDLHSFLGAKVGYDVFLSENVFFEPAVYFEKSLNSSRPFHMRDTGTENILGLSFGFGGKF